jgi:CheY-like chemotaxis protein
MPDLPALATGDAGRFRQILLNLINNAIKFTDRGEVVVSAQIIHQSATSATLRIQIRDSGIGIPPHAQHALFTPFTQIDNSFTRSASGTGLGLAISRQLANKMGGDVGFTSRLHQGSTFWFTIELANPSLPQPETNRLPATPVLIVDDNDAVRTALSARVLDMGGVPHEAVSPAAAVTHLETLPDNPAGFLLLDEHLPGGIAILEKLATHYPHWHPVLLRCPGLPTPNQSRGLRIPMLPKPVLSTALWELLTHSQADPLTTDPPPPAPTQFPARSGLVLLVEDNLVNRTVTTTLLRKMGITVHEAGNGIEALEAATRTHYDLIFMDCQMPTMDGYEAAREFRYFEAGRTHTPIVALTAHAMDGDRDKCLAAGMDAYLTKPVTPATLYQTLTRWIPASPADA